MDELVRETTNKAPQMSERQQRTKELKEVTDFTKAQNADKVADAEGRQLDFNEGLEDTQQERQRIETEYRTKEAKMKEPGVESVDGTHNKPMTFSWWEDKPGLRSISLLWTLILLNAVSVHLELKAALVFLMINSFAIFLWWEFRKRKVRIYHTYEVEAPYMDDEATDAERRPDAMVHVPHKYPAKCAYAHYEMVSEDPVYSWLAGIKLRQETLHVSRTLMRHAQTAFSQNFDDDYETISGRLLRTMQRLPINVPAGEFDEGRAIYRDSHRIAMEWVKSRVQAEQTPNYGPIADRTN